MLLLLLLATLTHAEWVSPDTKSAPVEKKEEPKIPKAPPECVSKILEMIYSAEKELFASKKAAYSDSTFELKVASKMGLGCAGWDLPEVKVTYGGTGFTATMNEQTTKMKWTINQDKALFLDVSETGPVKAKVKN